MSKKSTYFTFKITQKKRCNFYYIFINLLPFSFLTILATAAFPSTTCNKSSIFSNCSLYPYSFNDLLKSLKDTILLILS